MSTSVQSLVVALIVAACAWQVARRFAPKTAWRLQAALSFAFERPGRPAWSRAVGRWLRPSEVVSGGGCGSGCNTCGGCATNPPPPKDPLALRLLP